MCWARKDILFHRMEIKVLLEGKGCLILSSCIEGEKKRISSKIGRFRFELEVELCFNKLWQNYRLPLLTRERNIDIVIILLLFLLCLVYFLGYRNKSAEKLYGYKDHEVIGQSATELLIDEEHQEWVTSISERLCLGKPWSGQLPCKKRSGQSFMAMVTKNPLYEDEELLGVITVSSDAALFNSICLENLRSFQGQDNGQAGLRRIHPKRFQWHPRPLIAPSVSNLVFILNSPILFVNFWLVFGWSP